MPLLPSGEPTLNRIDSGVCFPALTRPVRVGIDFGPKSHGAPNARNGSDGEEKGQTDLLGGVGLHLEKDDERDGQKAKIEDDMGDDEDILDNILSNAFSVSTSTFTVLDEIVLYAIFALESVYEQSRKGVSYHQS